MQDEFTIFDNEERVIRQAEELAVSFEAHSKLVRSNLKSLTAGYRRSYREQQRLIRLSDRQQDQLRQVTLELQQANKRLEEQADKLTELNEALEEEIKQRKVLEEELRAIAMIDALTSVYSRRQIFEFGSNEMKRFTRTGHPLCILALDLDHFKRINDTYGHQVGDRALRHFADVCRASLRTTDMIGRIGGEEFVVIMPDTDGDSGYEVAERIRVKTAETPLCVGENKAPIPMTVSIGVHALGLGESFEHALEKADRALYEAKGAGRNHVAVVREII